jgi:HEPN domain-containing protein
MPPDLRDPTRPAEWLRRARSNLALARAHTAVPDVLLEDLCFDAQQAAEKAIKAVLVHHQIDFPKTHVLTKLLELLAGEGVAVPDDIREANRLNDYAVATRYVGLAEDVTDADYRQAIELASRVVRWAESAVVSTTSKNDRN